jgi:cell shape-determining protein MreC
MNKMLTIVLLVIAVLLLYLVFTGNGKLDETVKLMKDVNVKVRIINDSLQNAQNSIQGVLKKLEFTGNELKILKAERDLLELEEQKKKAKNWEELQKFKEEIKRIGDKKDSLQQEAKKYDL